MPKLDIPTYLKNNYMAQKEPFYNSIIPRLINFFTSATVTAGIDIGSSALKIVELKKTQGGFTLNNFVFAPIPAAIRVDELQRNQFIISAIKEAKREGKIRSIGAFLSLSGPEVNILSVTVPKAAKSNLGKAIIIEVKKQISFDPKESFLDFQISSEIPDRAGPKLQIVAAVAQRKTIAAKLDILAKAGFQPLGVNILPNVLGGILQKATKIAPDETTCVLEMGSKLSSLSIFKTGKLEFSREVAIAGDHLTQALVRKVTLADKEINITLDQADKIKRDCGIPATAELEENIEGLSKSYILAMLRPTLERLTTETLRSLNYYLQTFKRTKIDRIFISGGSSRIKNIAEFLSKSLKDIKVEKLDPLTVMSGWTDPGVANQEVLEELAPQMSVALGLAMGKRPGLLDLLPAEIKIQQKLARIKTVFKIVAPVITLAILFFYFLASMQLLHYRRVITQAKNTVKSFASTRDLIAEYDNLKQKMESRQALLERAVGRQPLWWGILKELGWTHIEGVTLAKISVIKQEGQSSKLKVEGDIAPTYTSIDLALSQYMVLLDESPFFKDVKLVSTVRDVYSLTPKAKFEIMLELVY